MTTIAYKDGVIAYDSRITAGDLITNDDADKRLVIDDIFFFMTGATSDYERLIDLYFKKSEDIKNIDCSAYVVDDGKLFLISVDKDSGLWKQSQDKQVPCSIGSGSNFALTAMDMGASAYEAVQIAIKRDCKSGGKVRTFNL